LLSACSKFKFEIVRSELETKAFAALAKNLRSNELSSGPMIVVASWKTYPSAKSQVPLKSAVSVPPVAVREVKSLAKSVQFIGAYTAA
jgi:hypothetical protein